MPYLDFRVSRNYVKAPQASPRATARHVARPPLHRTTPFLYLELELLRQQANEPIYSSPGLLSFALVTGGWTMDMVRVYIYTCANKCNYECGDPMGWEVNVAAWAVRRGPVPMGVHGDGIVSLWLNAHSRVRLGNWSSTRDEIHTYAFGFTTSVEEAPQVRIHSSIIYVPDKKEGPDGLNFDCRQVSTYALQRTTFYVRTYFSRPSLSVQLKLTSTYIVRIKSCTKFVSYVSCCPPSDTTAFPRLLAAV